MLHQAFSLLFIILSFIFFLLSISTANSNIYVRCSQRNFTSNSQYESNVDLLYTSLVDYASLYNFNKFETSPQKDCSVYGLFQCRGDLSCPNCKVCVANAVNQLKTACPMSIDGEIQLEGCFVKYSDTSFFGVDDKTEVCKRCGPPIGHNSDVLKRIDDALGSLVGGSGQYFRVGDLRSIRGEGVAQCVQDLSSSDCQDCLLEARQLLKSECETSTWGDMYLGKCYIRYSIDGDGNLVNSGNSTSNNDGGISKNNIKKWVPIICAILVGGILIIALAFYCTNLRVKKKCEVIRDVKTDLDETKGVVKDVKTDLEKTKGNVKDIKRDLAGTKEEVKSIKRDVECGKQRIEDIRSMIPPPPPPPPQPQPPPPPCNHLTQYLNLHPNHGPPWTPCYYLDTCDSNPNTCNVL